MSLDKLTLQEIDKLEDSKKREALIWLGEQKNHEVYDFLARYIITDFRHQALISMANIEYGSTLDIVMGILKKETEDKQKRASLDTLSCIFFDRIGSIGEEKFLQEIRKYAELDQETRRTFYQAIEGGIDLTDIEDTRNYLLRARKELNIN